MWFKQKRQPFSIDWVMMRKHTINLPCWGLNVAVSVAILRSQVDVALSGRYSKA